MHPFIVVDLNCLRKTDVIASTAEYCRQQNLSIMLPDGSAQELSKCLRQQVSPLKTWKGSLLEIAKCSDVVVVGRRLSAMLEEESRTGIPCAQIYDDKGTLLFRNHLQKLANGDDSLLQDLIDVDIQQKMPGSLQAWSDHEVQKQIVEKLKHDLSSSLSSNEIKALRQDIVDGIVNWFSSLAGYQYVFEFTKLATNDPTLAAQLTVQPSVSAGFASAFAALALYWLGVGGFESLHPQDLTNDVYDIEYSVLASLSHSLISVDKRQKKINKAIRGGIDARLLWESLVATTKQSTQ